MVAYSTELAELSFAHEDMACSVTFVDDLFEPIRRIHRNTQEYLERRIDRERTKQINRNRRFKERLILGVGDGLS